MKAEYLVKMLKSLNPATDIIIDCGGIKYNHIGFSWKIAPNGMLMQWSEIEEKFIDVCTVEHAISLVPHC